MIQKLFLVRIESKTYVSVRVTYDSVVNDHVIKEEGGRKYGRRESSRRKQVKSVSKPVWVKPKWLYEWVTKKLPDCAILCSPDTRESIYLYALSSYRRYHWVISETPPDLYRSEAGRVFVFV